MNGSDLEKKTNRAGRGAGSRGEKFGVSAQWQDGRRLRCRHGGRIGCIFHYRHWSSVYIRVQAGGRGGRRTRSGSDSEAKALAIFCNKSNHGEQALCGLTTG